MTVFGNPGPGQYDITSIVGIIPESKYDMKRVRGKSVKMRKPDGTNSVFKSTTGRLIEDDINRVLKTQSGHVAQYELDLKDIGRPPVSGGAPNNFLLMKNERLVAPFQSTVTRFKH